ncbi:hypothetical protein [Kitasatospora sp. NPDC057015]|uniref:hypothetical protein n=1 Tax=Kitasatospora sp. NPDC057015 TaxID=3346001 RepID=UPI003640B79D
MLTMIIFVAVLGVLVLGLTTWLVARGAASADSVDGRPADEQRTARIHVARSTDQSIATHRAHGPTADDLGKYDK